MAPLANTPLLFGGVSRHWLGLLCFRGKLDAFALVSAYRSTFDPLDLEVAARIGRVCQGTLRRWIIHIEHLYERHKVTSMLFVARARLR